MTLVEKPIQEWHNFVENRLKVLGDHVLGTYRQYTMERHRLLGEAEKYSDRYNYLEMLELDIDNGDDDIETEEMKENKRHYHQVMDQVQIIDDKLRDMHARYPDIQNRYRDYVVQDRVQYSRKTERGDVDDSNVQDIPLKRKRKIN